MTHYDAERDVGDWRTPTISISTADDPPEPALGTVTCAVEAPDGTITAVVMTAGSPTATATPWTGAEYELTAAGLWVERFTITGDGRGKARQEFWVNADPGAAPTGERVYATTTDYANAIHEAPPDGVNLRRVLAAATRVVEGALLTAIYVTDTVTLLPTDAAVAVAIRDAVVEQARWQIEQDDPYGVGGESYQDVAIGSVRLGRGSGGSSSDPPGRRSPEAMAILARAGLSGQAPQTDLLWWSA